MTIPNETATAAEYVGNGVTTSFATTFPFLANSDVLVTRTTSGLDTTLVEGTDYSLTGAGETAGGTVVLAVALASGSSLTIERNVPLTQETAFRSQGSFSPVLHEKAFDKITMVAQQLYAETQAETLAREDAIAALRMEFGADPNAAVLDARTVVASGSTTARALNVRFGEHVNVKDFGALGNGSANDTAAITAAVAAANSTHKELVFPAGIYIVTDEFTLTSGVNVVGWGGTNYGTTPPRIIQTAANKSIFVINGGTQRIKLSNLWLSGSTTLGTYVAGRYGVKLTGAAPASCYRLRFEWMFFTGFERAVSCVGTDVTQDWQCDNVAFESCTFAENLYGIWMEARNADYWKADSCTFQAAGSGHGIHVALGGGMQLVNCYGADVTGGASKFVVADGVAEIFQFYNCQCEQMAAFFEYTATGPDDWYHPVLLSGCTVDSPIYLRKNYQIVLINSNISSSINCIGNDVRVYEMGCNYDFGGSIVLSTNSRIIKQETPNGVKMGHAFIQSRLVLPYGTSIAWRADFGNDFQITATNATAFTISNNWAGGATGQRVSFCIRNAAGGAMGAITWGSAFKMAAWTNPANGFSRSIDFRYDGTNWVEISRTPADVPN